MLKQAVMKEPALVFLDHTKTFEIQTNASDFAIGGVLMQEGHPITFESQKLNETEKVDGAKDGDDGRCTLL